MPKLTVGRIRKLIEGLPDSTQVSPDWVTDRTPSDYEPGVEICGACLRPNRQGDPYLSISVGLFYLEEDGEDDDDL